MEFGSLPSNIDLAMTMNDYALYMGFLGIFCGVMFWVGWNNHT